VSRLGRPSLMTFERLVDGALRERATRMASRMLLSILALAAACGGDDAAGTPDAASPTDVPFGTTAIIVVVNGLGTNLFEKFTSINTSLK